MCERTWVCRTGIPGTHPEFLYFRIRGASLEFHERRRQMRDSFELLRFLLRLSKTNRATGLIISISVLSGVIGGLGNTALIAMINDAIHGQTRVSASGIWAFAV